jgi:hypothetical protein
VDSPVNNFTIVSISVNSHKTFRSSAGNDTIVDMTSSERLVCRRVAGADGLRTKKRNAGSIVTEGTTTG